jgi:phosphoribosyl 1,2-cyclic phosphodiesterase
MGYWLETNHTLSMKIKIWGCRGSLTTPGAGTLRYGGHTTCLEVRTAEGQLIVIDAGSGLREEKNSPTSPSS